MTAEIMLTLDRADIEKQLAYPLICTTRESSVWETGKRKRLYAECFTEQERKKNCELFALAHKWYLKTGAPDSVKMTAKTLAAWKKLEDFCAMI